MFEVHDLHAGYGRIPILNGISFDVAAGEIVGVLGHNGMGKTTMLKVLAGQLPATGGSVCFNAIDVTRLSAFRRARLGIGYVPQGREIFPRLSVRENLELAMKASSSQIQIEAILDNFPGLAPLLERQGGALSGGEQQILALARCLCAAPSLILLDEPTEGVQPSIIDRIADSLIALRAERRYGVVVVEQNLEFIAAIADRILIIQRGRIIRSVMPEQLATPDIIDEFIGMQGT
jgi:urea ABC transporter ATP-binding protein UrtE